MINESYHAVADVQKNHVMREEKDHVMNEDRIHVMAGGKSHVMYVWRSHVMIGTGHVIGRNGTDHVTIDGRNHATN